MVDRIFFFIFYSLEKFLSASQLVIGNVMLIFRFIVKFEKASIKLLSYMSCKISWYFLGFAKGSSQGFGRGPWK